MADDSLLADTARDLYARPLAEFIAARNERVRSLRKDGHEDVAKQVAGFKKPSAGADAVNRLMRRDDQLADDVVELGGRLRAAQAQPVASELRALDQERRALVAAARAAAEESGDKLTEATLQHVEQTVWAALVDEIAAAAVLTGALVRPLSPGGFGEVDTTDASAVPVDTTRSPRPRPKRAAGAGKAAREKGPSQKQRDQERERERKRAERALGEAQDASRRAQDELEEAQRSADAAVERRADLERERDDLRARLAEVEQAVRDSKATIDETRTAVRRAERQRRDTAAEVDRALDDLDRA
jgi:hypothetical protein